MSFTAAQRALIGAVQAVPGRPAIVYPNHRGATPSLPRWVVQVAANSGRTVSLCGETQAVTEIMIRVEVEDGAFDTEASQHVSKIEAAFPSGRRIETASVDLEIDGAPQPRPALEGDGFFAVPVLIRARHFF